MGRAVAYGISLHYQRNGTYLQMKYPLIHPYRKFEALLSKGEELSLRKRFCWAFIRWGFTSDMEAKIEFVQLAKEFRKGRIGEHRTLLERKARKLYRSVRNYLNHESTRQKAREWGYKSKAEGIGVHAPEYKAKLAEHNKRIRQILTETIGSSSSKYWIVHSPEGEVFHIRNLRAFCREHGLTRSPMHYTSRKPGKTFRGWRCIKVDEEWNNL